MDEKTGNSDIYFTGGKGIGRGRYRPFNFFEKILVQENQAGTVYGGKGGLGQGRGFGYGEGMGHKEELFNL